MTTFTIGRHRDDDSLLPPTKEEVNAFARVCLFVCLSI